MLGNADEPYEEAETVAGEDAEPLTGAVFELAEMVCKLDTGTVTGTVTEMVAEITVVDDDAETVTGIVAGTVFEMTLTGPLEAGPDDPGADDDSLGDDGADPVTGLLTILEVNSTDGSGE